MTPTVARHVRSTAMTWCRPGPTPTQLRRDPFLCLFVVANALLSLLLLNSIGVFALESPPSWLEQVAWRWG
jgi:hypothetical protein